MRYTMLRRACTTMAMMALIAGAACNDFLVAKNPGAIQEIDVNDPIYLNLIANGPIHMYQFALSENTYWNGQITDELYNRATFAEEGEIDRRQMYSDMTYINAFMYAPAQRARFLGEDAARRLKVLLGDTATRDIRVARSLAYAGHSYILLGEMMCSVPIDLGAPKTPEEIFADAITKFDEAVTIATAAKAKYLSLPTINGADTLAADSVKNFALVGAARAALGRDDKPTAISYAQQVPANFDFRAYYFDNSAPTDQRHRVFRQIGGTATSSYLRFTPFEAMNTDPRLPRVAGTTGRGFTPLSPPSYSTYTGTVAGGPFAATMSVRAASGLEAQYIIAEANGPTAATLTFVNQRRAVGGQGATAATGAALMAELRDQRSRDFYLDNHRLGDLRRYLKYYGVDLFPAGAYPTSTTGQVYDNKTCWPLPTNEIVLNPNIPK